ncbi:MAG: ABC transporter permease subunit [Anaerolineae bacterium]|nr:ABC transporter permease subunit [Anaerolineae bacterium]
MQHTEPVSPDAPDIELAVEDAVVARPSKSLWRETLERLIRKPSAIVGLTMLGFLVFIAVFAPLIATHDPLAVLLDIPEEGVNKRADPCIHLLGCPSAGDSLLGVDAGMPVDIAELSATNSLMAAASGSVIRVWEVDNGKELFSLEHSAPVDAISWAPNDQKILAVSGEEVIVWDVNRRTPQQTLTLEGGADLVLWNADGTRFLTADSTSVTIWDTLSWRPVGTIELDGERIAAEWNVNGTLVMTASGNQVQLWNAFVATEVTSIPHDAPITSATFNRSSNRILTTSGNELHVYNTASYEELFSAEYDGPLDNGAWGESISRGIQNVLASSGDVALMWEVNGGDSPVLELVHGEPIRSIQSSPLSTRIFTQGEHTVRVWDTASGKEVVVENRDAAVVNVEWENNGGAVLLASGSAVDVVKTTDYQYLMGVDGNIRDQFSRVIYGARLSLMVGLVTVTFAVIIGTIAGAIAGFAGGWADNVIMRIMDVMLAFPPLILAIAVVTVLGPGLINALLAISIVFIPAYARVARSGVLAVKEEDFVTADRALGVRPVRILFRRILPNALAPLIVQATLGIGTAILDAAALSFLGLGAQPPTPEWGAMLGAERNQIFTAPHLVFYPGIAIMITVLAFNLLGDGLRDALDPRLDR